MSLYDDLEDKGQGHAAGWGSSHLMLETQKKLQAKSKHRRLVTPFADAKKPIVGQLHFDLATGKIQSNTMPFISEQSMAPGSMMHDEYDPFHPNEYEDLVHRKREQKRREREDQRKKDAEIRDQRRKDRYKRHADSDDSDKEEDAKQRSDRAGAAIAPPKSLMEEDPDDKEASPPPSKQGRSELGVKSDFGVSNFAAKIMAKFGYEVGKGLGKSEQGISQALQVEKTSRRGGRIINEPASSTTPAPASAASTAQLLKNPTKVILLRNMVGPGEVDEDLEPETAEECSKYGKVVKCLIYEMPNVSPEEAVRIFIEFERQEAAIKAIVDLNGRYFGGRSVLASFYSHELFSSLKLAIDVSID